MKVFICFLKATLTIDSMLSRCVGSPGLNNIYCIICLIEKFSGAKLILRQYIHVQSGPAYRRVFLTVLVPQNASLKFIKLVSTIRSPDAEMLLCHREFAC